MSEHNEKLTEQERIAQEEEDELRREIPGWLVRRPATVGAVFGIMSYVTVLFIAFHVFAIARGGAAWVVGHRVTCVVKS